MHWEKSFRVGARIEGCSEVRFLEVKLMRKVNLKQFLKILKGEDLEFRISPFAFSLDGSITINDVHLPYDLDFQNCTFGDLTFKKCHFSGNLKFDRSVASSLSFDSCLLHNLEILNVDTEFCSIKNSYELRELRIVDSNIDVVQVEMNPIYEVIHLGCGNNIRNCTLMDNGISDRNSFSTRVFICPERFDMISIGNMTTDILHIGTFGQYAQLNVTDINAEMVLIEGCSSSSSKVNFQNIKPLDEPASAFHLVNTVFDQEIFNAKAFQNYKVTKIHHEKVDVSALSI